MDFKIKGYERFSGEFMIVDVKISSLIVDSLTDEEKLALRESVTEFISSLFNNLSYQAKIVRESVEEYEQLVSH